MLGLLECRALSVLDISENKVDDERFVDEVLLLMPALRVLYNQGNTYIKKVKNYRKELIAKMKELRYLDD